MREVILLNFSSSRLFTFLLSFPTHPHLQQTSKRSLMHRLEYNRLRFGFRLDLDLDYIMEDRDLQGCSAARFRV